MLTKQGSALIKPNDCCYISCGCNRTPHCMDWGNNNLICYGACHSVAIYDPKEGGGGRVLVTLNGHKGRVNSVRWIRGRTIHVETELVSVSSDSTAIIWSLEDGVFKPSAKLSGSSGSLNVVDALYIGNNLDDKYPDVYIAAASADSTVKIWHRKEGSISCIETFRLGSGGICFALGLTHIPGHELPLLACGNDDCRIHLFSGHSKLISLAGHEDWIRAVDFTVDDNGDVLLASGAQDTTVRIWRISKNVENVVDSEEFKQEEHSVSVDGVKWSIILESILSGHESWVYSVHWCPKIQTETGWVQPAKLLSCSLDRTIVVWGPEEETGVWLEQIRVGELGGNTLGYYGSRFGPSGNSILGHSFQGAFHMWNKTNDRWKPGVTVGGHFSGVSDIGWEAEGRYLLSVSLDQTTRLHAPWVNNSTASCNWSWHEMCRPQIHGYDMFCLAVLPKYSFVSGSEEKVGRVFTAPQNSLVNLNTLTKLAVANLPLTATEGVPCGAAVPALGLSNKAVFSETVACDNDNRHPKDEYSEISFTAQYLTEPGSEDYLVQNSLWPEVMKLYGHGYEVFSLTASHSGDLLASACKATSQEHAKIILWNTKTWDKIQELAGHQLTVTQMSFSPDDAHLLSVSRDRRWCLFKILEDKLYHLIAHSDKANGLHTRIIWTCSWTHDSKHFATGSREGRLVIWGKSKSTGLSTGEYCASSLPLQIKEAVTAVCFANGPVFNDSKGYFLAVGSENGMIQCYCWNQFSIEPWRVVYKIDEFTGHHLSVEKIAIRPILGKTGDHDGKTKNILQLASCSLDCSVRVHNINIEELSQR